MKVQHKKALPLDRNCKKCIYWTGLKGPEKICGAENSECVYMDLKGFSIFVKLRFAKLYRETSFWKICKRIWKYKKRKPTLGKEPT